MLLDGFHTRTASMIAFFAVIVVIMTAATEGSPVLTEYMKMRAELIAEDSSRRIGAQLVLTPEEKFVSDIFVKEKTRQIEDSRLNRTRYIPSLSFFTWKTLVENTTLFKLMRRLPKGGALHLHDTSITSLDWLVKNATYRKNIYMCLDSDGLLTFHAFLVPPKNSSCEWKLVNEERAKSTNVEEFDLSLKRNLSLVLTDPVTTFADNAEAWVRFGRYFSQVQDLVYYVPIFRDYFWQALEEFLRENIQYLELRATMEGLYDINGTVYGVEDCLLIYKKTVEDFVKVHPDFIGAKFIKSGIRNYPVEKILEEVKTSMDLHKKYPDVFAGYDMSGNEAYFNPLIHYIEALLYPSRQNPPYKLPYFLHVGETIWQGTPTDDNLVEAILLNATRIGHGCALPKRPELMRLVRERNIPLEVNPISNQMLRLVTDPRNNPMVPLMAEGFSIVISSDDIATWEAMPLSQDYYMAYMDMTGQNTDLTFLKQLANNSITYSAMNETEKERAFVMWEDKWNLFIQEVVQEFTPDRVKHHRRKFCSKRRYSCASGKG